MLLSHKFSNFKRVCKCYGINGISVPNKNREHTPFLQNIGSFNNIVHSNIVRNSLWEQYILISIQYEKLKQVYI